MRQDMQALFEINKCMKVPVGLRRILLDTYNHQWTHQYFLPDVARALLDASFVWMLGMVAQKVSCAPAPNVDLRGHTLRLADCWGWMTSSRQSNQLTQSSCHCQAVVSTNIPATLKVPSEALSYLHVLSLVYVSCSLTSPLTFPQLCRYSLKHLTTYAITCLCIV